MMDAAFFGLGLILGAFVAWFVGVKRGAEGPRRQLESLLRGLKAGNLPHPERTDPGEIQEIKALRTVLSEEWTRVDPHQGEETRRALGRIAQFLRHRVEAPLLEGLDGGTEDLRDGADEALGAVEDLEFFLEDPPLPKEPETIALADLVQAVTREFATQSSVLVKVQSPPEAIRVQVEPEPIKDSIFLILHNAAEFGGGQPVELILGTEGSAARVLIRDQGPGFSAEALMRAMDPFYSTAEGNLGLGLPHARRAVNGQGGEIFVRNGGSGGGEVEIRVPLAD
jgi:signal transduction histidine kinase